MKKRRRLLFSIELVLLAGLIGFSWILRHNPAVDPDSERFMDYAFLKATLRSPGLPVADPWFSGESIPYYHFAYAMTAFLVRAAGTDEARFFGTALALLQVLTWAAALGLGLGLTGRWGGGLLAAILVLGAGNFEWIRQAVAPEGLARFDWFASSRAIGGGITEFPWFSLLWGDLHPYVAALPLFLAALVLPLDSCLASVRVGAGPLPSRRVGMVRAALFAIVCGALLATHPWDLPFVVLAALWMACLAPRPGRLRRLVATACMPIAGAALFWPFLEGFLRHRRVVELVSHRTPIPEWLMAYGPFVLLGLWGLVITVGARFAPRSGERPIGSLHGRAVWAIAGTGLVAALLCEIVYVKDLFSATDLARMNTIFKLYRIAWVGLALGGASLIAGARRPSGRAGRFLQSALLAACLAPAAVYPVAGTAAWLRAREAALERAEREGYGAGAAPGADAEALFRLSMPGDAMVAAFLAGRARPGETVLEETGAPYGWSGRIATFSGVPSVLGWGNHEAVWRDSWAPIQERQRAIDAIYVDPLSAASRSLLRRYNVAWVVVGDLERKRYGPQVAAPFARLGTEVVQEHGTSLFRLVE